MNMMGSSREGYEAKQEGENNNMNKFSKASSTSRQWSGFRNPRIVRVSRSFGGKDRHSKVCTIRGLRDRRIRLSVPTAIQLYDLQDKLGLSQPSKVIDWLLEATKFDIDKLPPLHFPQSFSQLQYHPQTLLPFHDSSASHLSLGDPSSTFQSFLAKSRYWDNNHIESISRLRGNKEIEKGKWIKANEHENQEGCGGGGAGGFNSLQVSTQKLFPMGTITTTSASTHSPLQGGLLNNANISYNHSYTYEPNALSLSQFGSHGLLFPSQVDPYPISSNGVQFQPSLPLPVSSGSQFLFGPSSSTTSIFSTTYAPFMATSVMDNDARQFQFLNSGSQLFPHHNLIPSLQHSFSSPVRPLTAAPFSSKLLDSNDDENDKDRRKDKGSTCS